MGISVNLDKSIEHWAVIGRIAEENPGLNYDEIRGILLGLEDVKNGDIEEYRPGSL